MQPRNITLQTRVNADFYDRLQVLCEIKNMSVSEYSRNAIMKAVSNEKQMYKALLEKAIEQGMKGKKVK